MTAWTAFRHAATFFSRSATGSFGSNRVAAAESTPRSRCSSVSPAPTAASMRGPERRRFALGRPQHRPAEQVSLALQEPVVPRHTAIDPEEPNPAPLPLRA